MPALQDTYAKRSKQSVSRYKKMQLQAVHKHNKSGIWSQAKLPAAAGHETTNTPVMRYRNERRSKFFVFW